MIEGIEEYLPVHQENAENNKQGKVFFKHSSNNLNSCLGLSLKVPSKHKPSLTLLIIDKN